MQTHHSALAREDTKRRGLLLLAVISLSLVVASAVATQSLASSMGEAEGFWHLRGPWMWLVWYLEYADTYPEPFERAAEHALSSFAVVFMLGSVGIARSSKNKSHIIDDLHGSARFASAEEVASMGLKAGSGVYVGGYQNKGETEYLIHDGPEHVFAYAPTRSGKGVGLVVPTLLTWRHSVIVFDIKGENWALTAGWRKKHAQNHCIMFDPTKDEGSAKYNPLNQVRLGTAFEIADAQNLVTMIVDPDGKGLNDHWAKTGHALLVGALLHHMYAEKAFGRSGTLEGVAKILSDPAKPIDLLFDDMLKQTYSESKPHPVIAACAREMLNKEKRERSGVLSTALSFLNLYRDPIVAKNTASSDFQISDLMNNERPVSLYLIARPSDKDRLKPLFRLMINQILRTLTGEMKFKEGRSIKHYKHRLLLMLDEFPSLGRLDIFQESLAFIAGYGIKAYLIAQDKDQLIAHYGRHESITSNCHIKIAYAPNKASTASELSEMLGVTTVINPNESKSGKKGLFSQKSYTTSESETARKLMTPDETMRLPGAIKDELGNIKKAGDMLIFVAGFRPIYGKQILYFLDPVLSERARVAPPQASDRCNSSDVKRFELV